MAGPIHCQIFQGVTKAEEEQQQGHFCPLPQGSSSSRGRGRGHQYVDVELTLADALPRIA